MKIINKSNIPEALFKYLSQDNYDYKAKGSSYSVTELLNPTQIILLKRRHNSELVVDAIDRMWQMLGNGVHAILEKEEGIEKIERLKYELEGKEISGKWDRIINNEITDYKVTSAWTVAYKSREKEWAEQLSIYRWLYYKVKGVLLHEHGFIVALLRDWSEKEVGKKNYPKSPGIQIRLKLMSIEDTELFISKKILELKEAEKMTDELLPDCSNEESWYNEKKKIHVRCLKYCEVKNFCKQYQKEILI